MAIENFKVRLANKFFCVLPMSRMHRVKASILRISGIRIGKNVQIWSTAKFHSPHIEIGDNCFIGFNVQLFASKEGPIKIGKNCSIGTDVIITTGTHHPGDSKNRTGAGYSKPSTIGDGCRISTRSIILEGACLGDGSQVAAGAVVIRNVESNTLVGGVPARFIKKLSE